MAMRSAVQYSVFVTISLLNCTQRQTIRLDDEKQNYVSRNENIGYDPRIKMIFQISSTFILLMTSPRT